MSDHVKPTKEELEASIKATEEKLADIDTTEEPTEEERDPEPSIEPSQPAEDEEEVVVEEEEETQDNEEQEDQEEIERIKEQRAQSAREAQKLAEDKKKVDDAFHEAHNISQPTDEELKAEYPNWDELDDTTRRIAKDNLYNKKRFEAIDKANEERRTIQEWNDKIDEFIDNPKTFIHNPKLEGKQDEFREYATDKKMRNINLDIIIKSFLYEQSIKKVEHKGKMFETGKGGAKEAVKHNDSKLSLEEGRKLMKTDFNKYKELLKAGKISMDIS